MAGRRPMSWLGVVLACALILTPAAQALEITETPVVPGAPAGSSAPTFIAAAPDGGAWFADTKAPYALRRITPQGTIGEAIPLSAAPFDVALGPDGRLGWTTTSSVGRRLPGQAIQSFGSSPAWGAIFGPDGDLRYATSINYGASGVDWYLVSAGTPFDASVKSTVPGTIAPTASATRYTDVTAGPNGVLWLTAYEQNRIVRISGDLGTWLGAIDLPAGSGPYRIASGPDGNMWVASYKAAAIDRITRDGERRRFALPPGSGPTDIVAGPDGALWFTDYDRGRIGRITVDGEFSDLQIPTSNSRPWGIAATADSLWFAESAGARIGRIVFPRAQPPGGPPGPGPGAPAPGSDRKAPVFTRPLRAGPRRFRAGTAPTALAAARRSVPVGTTWTFALSEQARVRFSVQAIRRGVVSGRSCRAPTRRRTPRTRTCIRYVPVGALTRARPAGPARVAFSGRLGRRALAPGPYRVVATAVDAAQNISAPSGARFTVVSARSG